MASRLWLFALLSSVFSLAAAATDFSSLPVFFFHGVRGNRTNADNFVANLTAEGRTVVPLTFCEMPCSLEAIVLQVPKAVAQIREIVANSSEFDNGYIFLAHSQGGAISRAVIEEMDDHKVKRYISMAGLQNGQFIGPDKVEYSIANDGPFLASLVPETMFNYSAYGPEDYYGKMQKDYVIYTIENPDAQYTYSQFNVNRWPQFGSFSTANFFLPVYNNVNRCLPVRLRPAPPQGQLPQAGGGPLLRLACGRCYHAVVELHLWPLLGGGHDRGDRDQVQQLDGGGHEGHARVHVGHVRPQDAGRARRPLHPRDRQHHAQLLARRPKGRLQVGPALQRLSLPRSTLTFSTCKR